MTSQTRIETGPGPDGDKTAVHDQYGALCWRMRGGKVQVLLVTSRDTGRWIIPKGWPMEGRSPAATAAREAREEAGVEGKTGDGIGVYTYAKDRQHLGTVTCAVQVFPVRVGKLERRFPERAERRRKWFDAGKAARKVAEPELRSLILAFAGLPPQDTTPAEAPAGD